MENELASLINEIVMIDTLPIDKQLFNVIKFDTAWDNSMLSRKTVSYGVPYNYSGQEYEFCDMPGYLNPLLNFINDEVGFMPNNCLVNYYVDGKSKMGFHSDQTDQLATGTGIVIVSLGNTRVIRFRSKTNKESAVDFTLNAETLFYMSQEVQEHWMHAVLPDKDNLQNDRISLTFRKLVDS